MSSSDPYVYPGTFVLRNKLDICTHEELRFYEKRLVTIRLVELYENPVKGDFDFEHLKRIHHHLFQDIYDWSGQERTVDIMKYPTYFCPTQNINPYSDAIFSDLQKANYFKGLDPDAFAQKTAELLDHINTLHPFREGNGRTQREFIRELALNAGYDLDLSKATAKETVRASIKSYFGHIDDGFLPLIKTHLKPIDKPDGCL